MAKKNKFLKIRTELDKGNLKKVIEELKHLRNSENIEFSKKVSTILTKFSILEEKQIKGTIDSQELLSLESKLIESIIEIVFKRNSLTDRNDLALIIKGGGIKGLAYVGALEELSSFYSFNWFVGTSAGAITALLLAAGYSTNELQEILESKDFSDFKDAPILKWIPNLLTIRGLFPGNKFKIWIEQLLAKKLQSPVAVLLKDLNYRCTIYATRRGKEALVFDSELESTKETEAGYAARCSMSIPIIFSPQKHEGLDVFDGGSQNNYPVAQFKKLDSNLDFIGLYLGPKIFEGNKRKNIIMEYFTIWQESSDIEALRKYSNKTVIIDPRPISTLQLSLSSLEKEFLLENGRLSAIDYLIEKGLRNLNESEQLEIANRKLNLEETRKALVVKKRRFKLIILLALSVILVSYILFKSW